MAARCQSLHFFLLRNVWPSPSKWRLCWSSGAGPSFFGTGLISYPKNNFPGGNLNGCGPARFLVDLPIPGIETVPTGVDVPGVDEAVEDPALPFFSTSLLPPPEKLLETLAVAEGAIEE